MNKIENWGIYYYEQRQINNILHNNNKCILTSDLKSLKVTLFDNGYQLPNFICEIGFFYALAKL